MGYEAIEFDVTESVATITLNRPKAFNALNVALARDLMEAAIRCQEDDVRAVALTGSGRGFCGGGDLAAFSGATDGMPALIRRITTYLHAAVSRFTRMDAPLVIAVNGVAAGAGMSLALTGDIVIAAESARFTMAYTRAGLVPDGSSSFFLPRLVGLRRAQELMLTNRTLTAAEALDWGLVTEVVPDQELLSRMCTVAADFAKGPTRAFGGVKKLLASSASESLETQMERETRAIAASAGTADAREGVTAFLEKRSPTFTGE
jgi:2-(1,2-epoxy-1,2-dihydrophenyl)acetyl-CoA isomerase